MAVKLTACGQVTRVIFIIINIIFLLLGIGLIAGGSYLVATGSSLSFVTGHNAVGGAALLIIAGIATVIITACGLIGAIFLSKALLVIYLVVVCIVIALELIAGILGIVYRGKLESGATDYITGEFEKYLKNDTKAIDAVDFLQKTFQCCGWNSSADWVNRTEGVPDSCDCTTSSTDRCMTVDDREIWKNGCRNGVLIAVVTYVGAIAAIGILFALFEVVAVLLAIGLCCCVVRGTDNYTKV